MFRFILKKYFKNKIAYFLLILSIITFIMNTFLPYLNGKFIDFLLINNDESKIIKFAFFIAIIGILSIVSSYVLNIISIKILNKTIFGLINDNLYNLMMLKLEELEKYNTAYLTQRVITDISTVSSFVIQNYVSIFLNGMKILIAIIIFAKIKPMLLLLLFSFIPIYSLAYIKMKKPLFEASINQKEKQNLYYDTINTQLLAIMQIKIFNSYSKSLEYINKSCESLYNSIINKNKLGYIFSSIDSIVGVIFQSIMFFIGGISILRKQMSIGEFTIINAYFSMIIESVKYYIDFLKSYQDSLASFCRLDILNLHQYKEESNIILNYPIKNIELDNINYFYNSENFQKVFKKNINLTIDKEGLYSIIGSNGSGKSTLFKIIIGLYHNYKGKIIINNIDYKDLDLKTYLNSNIAAVPQNLVFDSITVKDYLGEYKHSILKNTSLGNSVNNLLNKNCNKLSGGEARKVALFKAFSKEYDIIILDEPTTGLDQNSKKELLKYIDKLKKTKIVIVLTHYPGLIDLSDKKYVI